LAPERPRHRPGPRQRMVDGGDLDAQEVLVGRIEREALLDDALPVLVQRDAAAFEGARPLEAARLDLEHAEAAVRALLEPLADRIAQEARLDLGGPGASIRKDAARLVVVAEDVSGLRRDDDLHRIDADHHARQAVRYAKCGRVAAEAAGGALG